MALILDWNGIIVTANPPLLSFLGCSLDTLEGRNIHSEVHPLLHAISTHLAGDTLPGALSDSTHEIVMGQGISHLKMKKMPMVFEDGTSGSVFMIEDITSDVLSRDTLKTSEAQYKAIVETLKEMVIRFLPDGTKIFGNRAYLSYFHSSPNQGNDESFFSVVHPADIDTLRSHLATLSPGKPLTSLPLRVIPAEGMPAWNTWTFQGIFDHEERILVYQGVGRDIMPEIAAEEQTNAHIRELGFLISKCRDFQLMNPDADIFRCIANHIGEMIPGATTAVFAIDQSESSFTLKAQTGIPFTGEGTLFKEQGAINYPCSLDGKDADYVLIRDSLLTGSLVETGGYFCNCYFQQVCQEEHTQAKAFIEAMGGYSAGLAWEDSLLGAVEIFTKKIQSPLHRLLIEAYISIASLALHRWVTGQALMTSEERFMRIATTNPLPISIIDQYGRYTYVSPSFTELFGYTLEDIPTGRDWFIHAFPDLAEQKLARETWKRDLAESSPGNVRVRQFRVRCKDGVFKEISFLPVSMSDGQQLIVYEDVTPRLEATQTKNLLFDIFRSSHDGIFSATIDGRILSWNPAAERIYGYTAEEVEGRDVHMLEPPHLKGEISAILERVRHGEYIAQHETQRVRKDGKLIDVSLTISPVYEEGGAIMGASTIIRDITARKAEERLRNVEMKYQDLVDNINVGVYRSTGDPMGKFIWGNTSLLRILGYKTLDDLQEVTVSEIFARSTGREELLAELRQRGFVKNREIVLRKADDTVIHVLVTALATYSPDGSISHINGIVEDITSQRLLEQKIARITNYDNLDPSFPS